METPTLEGLQRQMGYQFSRTDLLHQALTHRSCLQDSGEERSDDPPMVNNERLEFLGDAVLELAISDLLFHHYPEQPEGVLSNWRSSLVNTQNLGRIGHDHHLGCFLKMGRGEALSGGRHKTSLLGNAIEALLGAVYLDGGYAGAFQVVQRIFTPFLQEFQLGDWEKDYKSLLQERQQGSGLDLPDYQVVEVSGMPHEREFQIACRINNGEGHFPLVSMGRGRSKRVAEQSAAKEILAQLEQHQTLPCVNLPIHSNEENAEMPKMFEPTTELQTESYS